MRIALPGRGTPWLPTATLAGVPLGCTVHMVNISVFPYEKTGSCQVDFTVGCPRSGDASPT
jgi:hypothetical protein